MNERILCVDDEPCVLQAYQRALRKRFIIEGAFGGEEALKAIALKGPYAVVVADMRMPGMNGIQLLVKAKEIAPHTVRMMLTGNADQQTALDAVNEGHIFRFMTKPCPPEVFAKALEAGIAQYRLVTAEHELLSQTLSGSIKVLTDVLGLVNPAAFGRSSRVHRLVQQLCREMGLRRAWLIEIAAMLSHIGCVIIQETTLSKVFQGQVLSADEEKVFLTHPQTARELLSHIPRLEEVVEIIVHQNDLYRDKEKYLHDARAEDIILGGYILKLALDWDTLISSGLSNDLAMAEISGRNQWYHPHVVAALRNIKKITDMQVIQCLSVNELYDGAVLADDIRSIRGTLLCTKGQEVTPSMRARLRNYFANLGIQTQIKIFAPAAEASPERILSPVSS
ncbi:MAG: HD domain-containing phosphohydrolase [Thermoguttaceae bacterium]|jgi:response regulator RpfG family c-di-GMP phosphodiesterase